MMLFFQGRSDCQKVLIADVIIIFSGQHVIMRRRLHGLSSKCRVEMCRAAGWLCGCPVAGIWTSLGWSRVKVKRGARILALVLRNWICLYDVKVLGDLLGIKIKRYQSTPQGIRETTWSKRLVIYSIAVSGSDSWSLNVLHNSTGRPSGTAALPPLNLMMASAISEASNFLTHLCFKVICYEGNTKFAQKLFQHFRMIWIFTCIQYFVVRGKHLVNHLRVCR